jgi:MtN3 and saliva related transmembrane protein
MELGAALLAGTRMYTEAIGFWAGICTTASFAPQLFETRKNGGHGLSWLMLALFGAGVTLWFVYGILRHSWPIILANGATGAQLVAIAIYKLRHAARQAEAAARR